MANGSVEGVGLRLPETPALAEDPCSVHRMPFGAELEADGRVRFRVWAPKAASLELDLPDRGERLAMEHVAEGWHELTTAAAGAGTRYRFVLPDGLCVPDPVSRYQPEDVNGPSEVVDAGAYTWSSTGWKGRPWEETVLYELHTGTFTPEGTFAGAMGRLDYLVELGVTAIEIMSVGDFPGTRNWGYDGVLLYAPDSMYGRPEDLKRLVDAAHARGIMVILDVVYNHFGPEGNYLPQLFPDITTDRYSTPWGQALNFDAHHGERTREFIIHNALYWIEEFRMDGLRLDAVHAIIDSSSTHILDELATRVRSVALDRHVHLILESDDTMWNRLIRERPSTPLLSTAQWNHDCKQLLVLGLTRGRSEEQDRRDTELLGRALVEGFTSQPPKHLVVEDEGEGRAVRGFPKQIPPGGFVAFLQTHDLVGNRIDGERITDLARAEVVRALAAVYLLSPEIPMLFMGEEWGASSPFPYFCDFQGQLADAVRAGRMEQFTTAEQRADAAFLASIPDPLAEQTYLAAKLDWEEIGRPPHAAFLHFYREVLEVRRREIVPLLAEFPEDAGAYEVVGPRSLRVVWRLGGGELRVDLNLSDEASGRFSEMGGETIWLEGSVLDVMQLDATQLDATGQGVTGPDVTGRDVRQLAATQMDGTRLGPWTVRWSLNRAKTRA